MIFIWIRGTVVVIAAANEDEAWQKLITTRNNRGELRPSVATFNEVDEEFASMAEYLVELPATVEAIDVTPNDLRALYRQLTGSPLTLTAVRPAAARDREAADNADADAQEEREVLAGLTAHPKPTREMLGEYYNTDPEFYDAAITRLKVAGRLRVLADETLEAV